MDQHQHWGGGRLRSSVRAHGGSTPTLGWWQVEEFCEGTWWINTNTGLVAGLRSSVRAHGGLTPTLGWWQVEEFCEGTWWINTNTGLVAG